MGETKNRKNNKKDIRMIRSKGFLQMFSVSGVGGSLDFHLDTHDIMSKTDYGKQTEAQEESKHNSSKSSISTDRDGTQHIYSDGCELASNSSGSSCYSSTDQDNSGNSVHG